MSKEQINYLLVLATLFIVWLYFNTFYVTSKKSYGAGSPGGMRTASAMRLPNVSAIPRVHDFLKALPQSNKAPKTEEAAKS